MLKVAMLADRLVMGGLETHLVTTINELLRRGHRVLLNVAYIAGDLLEQITDPEGRFVLREWSEHPAADLQEFDPDLIHSHPFTAIFRGYDAAQLLQKPFIVTMHGLYDFGLDRSVVGNRVCERVNTVIAVDHRVEQVLKSSIAHPEKITVIYNGINLQQFQSRGFKREQLLASGLHPGWSNLVVLSRLADGKERPIYQLLDCLPKLAQILSGINLLVVGDGGWFSSLAAKAEAVRNNDQVRVKMTGSRVDVAALIASADLVLACDRAAMEAMACQKAVLAMSAAGFAQVIGRANFQEILLHRQGYREVSNDEIISMLSRLFLDGQGREKLAREGRQIVGQYFDIRQTVDRLEAVYRQWLGASNGKPGL